MLKKLVKEILVLSSVIGCMPLTSIIAETNPCDSDPYSDACKTYSQKKKNALDAKNAKKQRYNQSFFDKSQRYSMPFFDESQRYVCSCILSQKTIVP